MRGLSVAAPTSGTLLLAALTLPDSGKTLGRADLNGFLARC